MFKYNGLRRRPTYNELIDYLHNRQETIKYPKRIKFNPHAMLEDIHNDYISNMNIDRKRLTSLIDRYTQTDPIMLNKPIQTDPYMFDKEVQVDDGENYDRFFNDQYRIIPETVENYSHHQKKTQTKRFEFILRQLQRELQESSLDDEVDYSYFGYPSLLHLLFGSSTDNENISEDHNSQYHDNSSSASSSHAAQPSSHNSIPPLTPPTPPLPPPPPPPWNRYPIAGSSRQRADEPFIDSETLEKLKSSLYPYYGFF